MLFSMLFIFHGLAHPKGWLCHKPLYTLLNISAIQKR